jgi:hypothetical protein
MTEPMTDRSKTPKEPAVPGGKWMSELKSKWKKKSYPTYLTVRIGMLTTLLHSSSHAFESH